MRFDCLKYSTYEVPNPYGVSWSSYKKMRSLRTLPTIFNCFKYSTYVVVKPDGVSWSAYISLKEKIQACLTDDLSGKPAIGSIVCF